MPSEPETPASPPRKARRTPRPTDPLRKVAKVADPVPSGEVAGVVLAGGRSTRFGSPKAAAHLTGRTLVERAVDVLGGVVDDVRIVGPAEPHVLSTGRPHRPDDRHGLGPLGGLETALRWASEDGMDAILVLAVDMPLVPAGLLCDVVAHPPAPIVVPESGGPAAIEPLCARYSVDILPVVERLGRAEGRSLIGLVREVGAERLPLAVVARHGDPDMLFLNVNTPADLERAELHLQGQIERS